MRSVGKVKQNAEMALFEDNVRHLVRNSRKESIYYIGNELCVLVNPGEARVKALSEEARASVLIIRSSPLSMRRSLEGIIDSAFLLMIEVLEGSNGIENASVLDLSNTAGLLGIICTTLGAESVLVVSDDSLRVKENITENGCSGQVYSSSKLSRQKDFDLVIHDLCGFPDLDMIFDHVRRLKPGGVLALVGMLGQQIPVIGGQLISLGMTQEYTGWLNEECFAIFKKRSLR